jgi:UDP-3-O-[3-hydroxymyristoyl] N-acetylglucosamine deacetylase
MKGAKQTTLRDHIAVSGIGVHSGSPVTLTLHPADDDTGIVFQRVSADGATEREIRADVRAVTATEFATVLGDAKGPLCSTAEHLLAALRGLHVDNVVVEIDGPEVPIMDGSAAAFVEALDQAGLTTRALPRRYIEVIKPVRVSKDGAHGELRPYEHGFRVEAEIEFDHPLIGKQALALDIEPNTFRKEIARARTFGFVSDVKKLWQAGFALGSSLENSVALDGDAILNPEGLRYADEFVRHKALDAIGDLALAGAPIIGGYHSYRPGHRVNAMMLSALFADRKAYEIVDGAPRKVYAVGAGAIGRVATAYALNAD